MSTTDKHTPGPWTLGGSLVSNGATTVALLLRKPAVYGGRRQETRDTDNAAPETGAEIDANAHLIATAPALLAEARLQLRWLRHIRPQITAPESVLIGFDQAEKGLAAVIAKAEGRE